MGDKSLADELKIDEESAKSFIRSFHCSFPGIKEFIRKIVQEARESGYVTTLGGRRRYLPDLMSKSLPDVGKILVMFLF